MNTYELEMRVRDALFEYQPDPISPLYIIRTLNEAYRFMYNHFVKSNDTLFAVVEELNIVSGLSEYDLPEHLWSKRVEHFQIPSPPNQSSEPWGWLKLPRMDWKQTYRYQTKRIRTYYPSCWTQLNNQLMIYPPPLINFTARMVVSRRLTPLGVYGGRIVALGDDAITLDALSDERLADSASDPTLAFISVCDHSTGELKALFPYDAVNQSTKVISLAAAPNSRTKFMDYTLSPLPGTAWGTIELDDYVCFGVATAVSIAGEAFDTFLTDWATQKVRGALNETDPEVVNSLKLQLQEIMGDTGGRVLGLKINRTVYNAWGARPYRN